jgi:hypothetical protein
MPMRWRSSRPLPIIPGRSSVGIGSVQWALDSGALRPGRSAGLSTSKLIRFHPTAANGCGRNRPNELHSAGRRLAGPGSASAAAQVAASSAGIRRSTGEQPWAMDIRSPGHTLQRQRCRNQTPATISCYPRIRHPSPASQSAPLLFVLPPSGTPVASPRHPPSFSDAIPSFTKMASENASASRGIKTSAAPVPGASLNQSTSSTASNRVASTLISTRVQRPAHFLNRPVHNTGAAAGNSIPTTTKRTMVSITPHSVNRTSLHPHGVQYVSPKHTHIGFLSFFELFSPGQDTDVTAK